MGENHRGLETALGYPLFRAIINRRSRRISKGIKSVAAGSLSYQSSKEPQPLTELEEALLIAATGITGVTMPDMPFQGEGQRNLLGTPMLHARGRAAASPDNAQATTLVMSNDSGTYLLMPPEGGPELAASGDLPEPELLIELARRSKVKVLEHRLDFPREVPAYFGRNRYVSNLPGSTVFIPIVDMTRQYINGFIFLLSQDDGVRPYFLDDWNFYRAAGCRKWVRNGFLNKDIKAPLGLVGTMRINIEADLLLQNLFLMLQAMGLGGWIHACPPAPVLLGSPEFSGQFGPGLGFRHERPRLFFRKLLIPVTPLPAWQPNPVGLDGILEGCCPPYHANMHEAVDAVVAAKYGPDGVYSKPESFAAAFKPGLAEAFVHEAPHASEQVIACTKDICSYVYDTYGRFPAHMDAFFVPGVCLQAHHLDLDYYDALYVNAYAKPHADHDSNWHEPA